MPAGGSCLLGSLNLSEFVNNPFEIIASFDYYNFVKSIHTAIQSLNEVLDEGLSLHPLEVQQDTVRDYRQIGLGVMGIADMLIKLNIEYGSEESLRLCDSLAMTLLNESVIASSNLANIYGSFPKYNFKSIVKSEFYKKLDNRAKLAITKNGLRNSQLLTIPPTGSISNLLGVSGGIEPIFDISYSRKTESLHKEGDKHYKVYTPIIKEYMYVKNITDEKHLPNHIITTHSIKPINRIKMQAIWQNYIDASISSTINLPNSTTEKEIYDIYVQAWKHGLKGVTIYRDGCNREGVLSVNANNTDAKKPIEEKNNFIKTIKCSECGSEIIANSGGCSICLNCGHSGCN